MNNLPESVQESTHDWSAIAASAMFTDLIAIKKAFIVPAFVFFLLHYFAWPSCSDMRQASRPCA